MTNEELMLPRYKVIADFPLTKFTVGNYLQRSDNNLFYFGMEEDDIDVWFSQSDIDRYPHLFKKLEWWEDRVEKDMPKYLKIEEVVYKIERWEEYFGWLPHEENPSEKSTFRVKHHFDKGTPSTEQEYNEYISKNV